MNAKAIYLLSLGLMSSIGGFLIQLFGNFDSGLQTLLILIAIDYLTGLICALVFKKSCKSADGTFESKLCARGLIRKGCLLLVVIVGYRLDIVADTGGTIRNSVILFFIANEGLSIVENLGIMGVPLPTSIKNAFAALKSSDDDETKNK